MPEGLVIEQTASFPPVPIKYEGDRVDKPFIHIDGTKLSQVLQSIGYPQSIIRPLVIKGDLSRVVSGGADVLAEYDPIAKVVRLDEEALINDLRTAKDSLHEELDDAPRSRIKNILRLALMMNPMLWSHIGQRDMGRVPSFLGDQKRREAYVKAAKNGFKGLSKEESIEHAKLFLDNLLELAAPNYLGWILAHEFEHRNNAGWKLTRTLGMTGAPLVAALVDLSLGATSVSEAGTKLAVSLLPAIAGIIGGKWLDENASFRAGDTNVSRFAQAISIDHDVFQQSVLRKPWVPLPPQK